MIEYKTGDLTLMKVDAIVNAANTGLVGGAGLCGMIHDAAGPGIDKECRKLGYCLRGEAKITKGYNLPAKFVIHTVGPIYGQHHGLESEVLYSHDITSIAFPYISTGIYQYPIEEAKPIAIRAIEDFLLDNPKTMIKKVYLVEYSN